jgi:hypothetical protein
VFVAVVAVLDSHYQASDGYGQHKMDPVSECTQALFRFFGRIDKVNDHNIAGVKNQNRDYSLLHELCVQFHKLHVEDRSKLEPFANENEQPCDRN